MGFIETYSKAETLTDAGGRRDRGRRGGLTVSSFFVILTE